VRLVKLLLDENVSPTVALTLRTAVEAVDAAHVRDRGMTGASDLDVLEKAFEEDRILVTANVGDFEKLAKARDLHGGIVLIEDGALLRDEQEAVLRRAVEAIRDEYAAGRDMVNRVLRITLLGEPAFETLP
jgi:predicted nuclease of predicted toxin-antitoxin system